jgi:UDP-N-acetylmuramate--alanine ligase
MNFNDINKVFMLGAGGMGMSALGHYFLDNRKKLAGYDRIQSENTATLEKRGAKITYEICLNNIPRAFLYEKEDVLVIYTPAVSEENTMLEYFRTHDYIIKKRSEILGLITKNKYTIAVAGTHGKTSTSATLSWMLDQAGIDHYAFLGGISANYHSNYHPPKSEDALICVVEADEFDRSFLQLNPDIAIVTALDPDHLDVYGDWHNMKAGYQLFLDALKSGGTIIMNEKVALYAPKKSSHLIKYGEDQKNYAHVKSYHYDNGLLDFTFCIKSKEYHAKKVQISGKHNLINTLAAFVAAYSYDSTQVEGYLRAMQDYKGVKRRFQYIVNNENAVFIDDYAHHPEEVSAMLHALREMYPGKEICVVFQPHLYSRTRDFAASFAKILSEFDCIYLLEIYPAREKAIEGVDAALIFKDIHNKNKMLLSKRELLSELQKRKHEVIITMGAGDIDGLVEPIKNMLDA